MLTPVICFTCGCSVGHVEELFRVMRTRKIIKELELRNTIPTHAAIDAGLQIDMSDILDKLNIRYECCRIRLATAMIHKDYY